MSATIISQLYAFAEVPGMPPVVSSEFALAETVEDPAAAQADFELDGLSETGLTEIEPTQTDMAKADLTGGVPAQENPTPDVDGTVVSIDSHIPTRNRDLGLYRERTVALLRRYLRLSIEVGRMPSLLGREFFRNRVTSYKSSTFEDSVIFVHDVERSLEELSEFEKKLIAKVVLQQFSMEEAGRVLGCGYRTVQRLFPEALDRASEILLRKGILTGPPRAKRQVPKSCQEGKNGPFRATD
jgi:hypothetical protein